MRKRLNDRRKLIPSLVACRSVTKGKMEGYTGCSMGMVVLIVMLGIMGV